MKSLITALAVITTFAVPALADVTLKIESIHYCSPKDETLILKALKSAGASGTIEDKPAANFPHKAFASVVVTAKDDAGMKKALTALFEAGVYGKGMPDPAPASDAKASSVTVTGAILTGPKCVKSFEYALKDLGVKTNADPGAKEVKVEGSVSPRQVQEALLKFGYGCTVK